MLLLLPKLHNAVQIMTGLGYSQRGSMRSWQVRSALARYVALVDSTGRR
jgi:hypothetical protein